MSDQKIRELALDPTKSFIVKAPAGSGKTELLTRRFLRLLTTVNEPEEIIAVTFTRKAASEMRQRIIERLPHSEAARCNEKFEWRLIENPNRLRIMTIDALCAMMANQMPILSHSGGKYEISDDSKMDYEKTIDDLLAQTQSSDPWYDSLKALLVHFDNRIDKVRKILALLLAKREQWLIYLADFQQNHLSIQRYFSERILRIIEQSIKKLENHFSNELKSEIENIYHQIGIDIPKRETAEYWKWMSENLLTKQNTWRKQFNKKNGFLSPSETKDKTEKITRKNNIEMMLSIMESLESEEELKDSLLEFTRLPDEILSENQAKILQSIGVILPVLIGFLELQFKQVGKVDFTQVTLSAWFALGEAQLPSDLALRLDYQIKHLLIDEYQDTSVMQYKVFEKLILEWQEGDGHSLFLVGDPMQSIYRFRGAEVNLFIKTAENGLGSLKLTPLELQMNFRSHPTVVQWINEHFSKIFPARSDEVRGAIAYSPSIAAKTNGLCESITLHPLNQATDQDLYILDLIEKNSESSGSLAVLIRSRAHLARLIPLLKRKHLSFVAFDAEHLSHRQVVSDFMALLYASMDFQDKVSWMALLRSPLLGITLSDLLIIANAAKEVSIWESLQTESVISQLSEDAQNRLSGFIEKLQYWFLFRFRTPLSHWVKGLWILLGGNQCYPKMSTQKDLEVIQVWLERFDKGGKLSDRKSFQEKIDSLYADVNYQSGSSKRPIELMTIHKAKGLEFDTVIIPHCEGSTRLPEPELLIWQEMPHENGIDLLFASNRYQGEQKDNLYNYIRHLHKIKEANEAIRLFYVAASRAKSSLHLVAYHEKPSKTSFWEMISQVKPDIKEIQSDLPIEQNVEVSQRLLRRLPLNWQLEADFQNKMMIKKQAMKVEANLPELADPHYRIMGTVFHRALQYSLFEQADLNHGEILSRVLKREGLPRENIENAVLTLLDAWKKMISDPKGQWILDPSHQERRHEWSISMKSFRSQERIVIDCAFIDKENQRWIVDYKLVQTKDYCIDVLIQKYSTQMNKYADGLSKLEKRSIRKGLYLPLQSEWIEL